MHLSDPPFVYWDTNVLIGLMKKEQDKIKTIERMIQKTEAKDLIVVTCPYTLTESWRHEDKECHQYFDEIKAFFRHEYRRIVSFDASTGILTQRLINQRENRGYKLTYGDSIHIAAALHLGVDALLTYDGTGKSKNPMIDLDRQFDYPHIRGRPLRIMPPDQFLQQLN